MELTIKAVKVDKPEDMNVIIGQAHFIKTVEDIYEALIEAVPAIKFGIAFCEASGKCLVRFDGNDDNLKKLAVDNAFKIGCGHTFFIALENAYPVNILNRIKNVSEVCNIFCATANPIDVIVVDNERGRGILGVIDGSMPKGVEDAKEILWRTDLLKNIGYKR
jgi:hypothetical protein